ncbi:MAG: thiamine-phosphate kinase [Candidatus Raymondbacteria bacterium RifOxyA12_full_50_37]|uniref:Thiamine-monophosphate kinase n=1 Tax=Candidatus Raymondbacteria bacterium RIFOXYD12_FULL_49_13 TaxID=1817890 RepID=A0A1F7F417_UNCRA|nr:MAG: thiamine-phosphate kinase [Candidatus Raymondbacteria bacterium RifOxyA12_full_50_37]OGJ93854.1 MAG: thiamine-phosphate kinase [Candidatus Raymondbacteria bacterium RIFOXYA2_FULL_49_16]OGJ97312.1 MAG: thiamine-phosphate kinase [Candidatus Raymondbacteria bacterium RifOxyC12_full_50_8]OGJ98277.1 MAG: thiamine-phosphate kinase [Candidatus Raymondbacteria bacterium RIFOXYC2_FULL_50_21]OGJ98441.1 MAG: thiamine-phosphate kinase [Candidatus Raymondbacteria bacterium RifOxyB12_full_50_8]OGK01
MKRAFSSEFDFISTLKKKIWSNKDKNLIAGIGDDCAVLDFGSAEYLLVTTDTFNEEIHFKQRYLSPYEAGFKAMSGAMSDIAAMGGVCRYALVSLSVPLKLLNGFLVDFYRGMQGPLKKTGALLIGGDTTRSKQYFSASITILGLTQKRRIVLRSGAQPGDKVFLTGLTGYSHAGLLLLKKGTPFQGSGLKRALKKHKSPEFRHDMVKKILQMDPTAMIDISDGLSSELNHLAHSSQVSIIIDYTALDHDPVLRKIAQALHVPVLTLIMNSGEEYELLFTSSKNNEKAGFLEIGATCKGKPGVWIRKDKTLFPVKSGGYDHFAVTGQKT